MKKSLSQMTAFLILLMMLGGMSASGTECEDCFITVWKTDNEGDSDDNQIIFTGYGMNYNIYWEEADNPSNSGNLTAGEDSSTLITFPHPGIYQVNVEKGTGSFDRVVLGEKDGQKLIEVKQWGTTVWSSMANAFENCYAMKMTAADQPDLSIATNMFFMFRNAFAFNSDISHWDVSNISTMSGLFMQATAFNQPLENWDVSHVENMEMMFYNASSFNQSLESWDVSNVSNMSYMFHSANSFNQPLESWDVSNVENMSYMFRVTRSFNQPLGKWNVSNVEDMSFMFEGTLEFNQSLEDWDVSSVKSMHYMFRGTRAFDQSLGAWVLNEDVINPTL